MPPTLWCVILHSQPCVLYPIQLWEVLSPPMSRICHCSSTSHTEPFISTLSVIAPGVWRLSSIAEIQLPITLTGSQFPGLLMLMVCQDDAHSNDLFSVMWSYNCDKWTTVRIHLFQGKTFSVPLEPYFLPTVNSREGSVQSWQESRLIKCDSKNRDTALPFCISVC